MYACSFWVLLKQTNWKPSYDDVGHVGSMEWVEENYDLLDSRALVYINVDCAVAKASFFASHPN